MSLPPDEARAPDRLFGWSARLRDVSCFVIVHGGFGGGWEWTPVAELLRERGHVVFTPTLTGMGERSHLGPWFGLGTHIDDVVAVLEFEDLHNVVLCGASYGGMAVAGAADRAPNESHCSSTLTRWCPWTASPASISCRRDSPLLYGPGPMSTVTAGSPSLTRCRPPRISSKTRSGRVDVARLRDQPVATFTEPIHLTTASAGVRRAFVRCTGRTRCWGRSHRADGSAAPPKAGCTAS